MEIYDSTFELFGSDTVKNSFKGWIYGFWSASDSTKMVDKAQMNLNLQDIVWQKRGEINGFEKLYFKGENSGEPKSLVRFGINFVAELFIRFGRFFQTFT